jgi:hypothetical protein
VKANLGNQQPSKWKGRPTTGFSLTQKASAILLQLKCLGWFFVQLILSVRAQGKINETQLLHFIR